MPGMTMYLEIRIKSQLQNLRQILVVGGGGLDSILFYSKQNTSKHEHYTQPSPREEHAGEED
jgi:hypothetical protein